MKKTSKTLIFFGSGPVGLASLAALNTMHEIEAVVTKPDPQSSRAPRIVADYAREHGLELYQPESVEALSASFKDISFNSKVGVVVDYGFIIAQDVIDGFEKGIINSHFSLLPKWRGADPITFALLSGQNTTGVSLMLISAGLDEGDILAQSSYEMKDNETIDSLTKNLVMVSNELLVQTIPRYLAGEITATPQDPSQQPTYSRKLTKQDGLIVWTKPAERLEREVRAYLGWPSSYTTLADTDVKILEAEVVDQTGKPGTISIADKQLVVYCGEKALKIDKLQPAGKRPMDAAGFMAGYILN